MWSQVVMVHRGMWSIWTVLRVLVFGESHQTWISMVLGYIRRFCCHLRWMHYCWLLWHQLLLLGLCLSLSLRLHWWPHTRQCTQRRVTFRRFRLRIVAQHTLLGHARLDAVLHFTVRLLTRAHTRVDVHSRYCHIRVLQDHDTCRRLCRWSSGLLIVIGHDTGQRNGSTTNRSRDYICSGCQ